MTRACIQNTAELRGQGLRSRKCGHPEGGRALGRLAALLLRHVALWLCSLVAPCQPAQSQPAQPSPILNTRPSHFSSSSVRSGIVVATPSKNRFKLRQERHIPENQRSLQNMPLPQNGPSTQSAPFGLRIGADHRPHHVPMSKNLGHNSPPHAPIISRPHTNRYAVEEEKRTRIQKTRFQHNLLSAID